MSAASSKSIFLYFYFSSYITLIQHIFSSSLSNFQLYMTFVIFPFLVLLHQSYKMDCCLTNSDAHVTSGSEDGYIFFWDLVDASVVSSFRAHSSVVCLSFISAVFLKLDSFSWFLIWLLHLVILSIIGFWVPEYICMFHKNKR